MCESSIHRLPTVPAEAKRSVKLLPYQLEDVECKNRFTWSCWSRQIGKSYTKSIRRITRSLRRRRNQIFLSASERQSRELMIKVAQHCYSLQIMFEWDMRRYHETPSCRHLEIRIPNGIRILGLPANPHTVRGFTGDVFLDEFAMHRDDREIWSAIFPSILRGDGELDVASTPRGCSNLFAELRNNPEFHHSIVTLPEAIAAGLTLDAEQIRRSMGDDTLYRQEFLCEFLDGVGAFLTYEQIAACEDGTLCKEPDWAALGQYAGDMVVGVDIGRKRDLTVMWILAGTPATPAWRTLGVIEMQSLPFREQYDVLRRLLSLQMMRKCCIDAGGIGMAMAEAAEEDFGSYRVEPVTFTCLVKDQMATVLKRYMEERRIRIPADEAIRNDLHSVQLDVTVGGTGRYVVTSSGDSHADRFWALALAVRAADTTKSGTVEFTSAGACRFSKSGIW